MEFRVLGGPEEGPTLDLDHRHFAYAGKFVMSHTGKAVAEEGGAIVAAVAFDSDRTDGSIRWLRYVTVRSDHRGDGIAPRLSSFVARHLLEDADRVRIAVNNPFAYHALWKAGFGYTGRETGIAEVVLERPTEQTADDYRDGLSIFEARDDISAAERTFIENKLVAGPPEPITASG